MLQCTIQTVAPTAPSFRVLKGDAIRGVFIFVQWQRVPVLTAGGV